MEVVVVRSAALDMHNSLVTACVRVPGDGDELLGTFGTFLDELQLLKSGWSSIG